MKVKIRDCTECDNTYADYIATKYGHIGFCSVECKAKFDKTKHTIVPKIKPRIYDSNGHSPVNKSASLAKSKPLPVIHVIHGVWPYPSWVQTKKQKKQWRKQQRKKGKVVTSGNGPVRMTRVIRNKERRLTREEYQVKSKEFLNSREWKELRFKAFTKHGRVCLCCGAKPPDVVLHVDHVKPRYHYPELSLSLDNLQVLCAACNEGKGAKFDN